MKVKWWDSIVRDEFAPSERTLHIAGLDSRVRASGVRCAHCRVLRTTLKSLLVERNKTLNEIVFVS